MPICRILCPTSQYICIQLIHPRSGSHVRFLVGQSSVVGLDWVGYMEVVPDYLPVQPDGRLVHQQPVQLVCPVNDCTGLKVSFSIWVCENDCTEFFQNWLGFRWALRSKWNHQGSHIRFLLTASRISPTTNSQVTILGIHFLVHCALVSMNGRVDLNVRNSVQ